MLRKHAATVIYSLATILLFFLTVYVIVKLFPFYRQALQFLGKLLSPFIISALFAYLLYPIVKKIESYRVQRSLSILIIYLFFIGTISLFIFHSMPKISIQLRQLIEQLPNLIYTYEGLILSIYESTSLLPEALHDQIDGLLQSLEQRIDVVSSKILNSMAHLFDLIIIITVIPVLTFYFLKDFESIKNYTKKICPKKYHNWLRIIVRSINNGLGNYIRGQFIVCLFVALASWIALEIIGLNYAALLGIIMGLTNIIPYFGPLIGILPAIAIAITQSSKYVFLVIIAAFIVQMLENNLLSPFIVGKSVNIHPIGIIFALILGGQSFGVLGMIIAVPLLTIFKGTIQSFQTIRNNR